MTDRNLGEGLEAFEEEVENLKNTKMRLFGITMTPTTIGTLFALLASIGGALYGSFEVYKDYMDMKDVIQNIDTDAIEARNNIIETKLDGAIDYTRDIKDGLKDDIIKLEIQVDRLEDMIDDAEQSISVTQNEIESTLKIIRDEMNIIQKDITQSIREVEGNVRNTEKDLRTEMRDVRTIIEVDMDQLENDVNERIQSALDNPLSNK